MEPRGISFTDAKDAELLLRHLISDLECNVKIEPITGTDMLYTDGMASRSNFKIIFTKEGREVYTAFYPRYSSASTHAELDEKIKKWVGIVENILLERYKPVVATRTVPISHPEEMGANGLMWTDVPMKYKQS